MSLVNYFHFQLDGWTDFQEEFDAKGLVGARPFTMLFIFFGHFIFTNIFIGVIITNISEATERFDVSTVNPYYPPPPRSTGTRFAPLIALTPSQPSNIFIGVIITNISEATERFDASISGPLSLTPPLLPSISIALSCALPTLLWTISPSFYPRSPLNIFIGVIITNISEATERFDMSMPHSLYQPPPSPPVAPWRPHPSSDPHFCPPTNGSTPISCFMSWFHLSQLLHYYLFCLYCSPNPCHPYLI